MSHPLDFTGRTVLLVDDVLYRGHSLARALDWALRRGAAEVRVAVLADRHVALLPVHGRAGQPAIRVLVRAVRGGRAPLARRAIAESCRKRRNGVVLWRYRQD